MLSVESCQPVLPAMNQQSIMAHGRAYMRSDKKFADTSFDRCIGDSTYLSRAPHMGGAVAVVK